MPRPRLVDHEGLLFGLGVASVVVAVVALFRGHGGSTATALVIGGMAIIGLLYVAPRLLTLRMGGVEVVLEKYAAEAREAEVAGDPDRAAELRQIAADVLEAFLARSVRLSVSAAGLRSQVSSEAFEDSLRHSLPPGCDIRMHPLLSVSPDANIILRPDYVLSRNGRSVSVDYANVLSEELRHRLRRQVRGFATMYPRPAMVVVIGGPKAVSRRLQAELDDLNLPVWVRVLSWRPGDGAVEVKMALEEALASGPTIADGA